MFKKEVKYLVLKWADIDKCLGPLQKTELEEICLSIDRFRYAEGKKDNRYVVVNEDEPYAEEVWKLIKDGEEYKNRTGAT